jgi:hypothetical protein
MESKSLISRVRFHIWKTGFFVGFAWSEWEGKLAGISIYLGILEIGIRIR